MGLTVLDYSILLIYVLITVGVGIWAGRPSSVQNSDDFFLAGRSASSCTVAVSLISGLTSGISFLGSPGYSYHHGIGPIFMVLGSFCAMPLVVFLIIPFFSRLSSPSAYAYLEQRFSKSVRTLAAGLFLLRVVMYLAIVLFAPAVAITAVTAVLAITFP